MTEKKRVGKVKRLIGITLISFAAISVFIYWFFGIKYIIELQNILLNRSEQDRGKVREMLTSKPGDNVFKGILLWLEDSKNLKGIWVWNYSGFRYIKSDGTAVFNTFSICEGRKWEDASGSVHKSANMNYAEWHKKVRQGDYLEISLNENGKLQNVNGYDWWAFASPVTFSYLEFTCKNRE